MIRVPRRKRGAVYAMLVIGLLALLGMAALSVDVGVMVLAKHQLQAAADAAALGGVTMLQSYLDAQLARDTAVATAASNAVMGVSVTLDPDVDIEVGAWVDETHEIVPLDESGGVTSVPDGVVAVRITARRTADSPDGPVPLHFAKVLGRASTSLTATATAGLTISNRERPPVQAVIVQDQSGSFADEFPYARDADCEFVNFMREAYAEDDKIGFMGFGQHAYHEFRDARQKQDTNLFHDLALTDEYETQKYGEGDATSDPLSDYIAGVPTVPYSVAPEHNSWTNVHTGLLRTATAFADPAVAQQAWNDFCAHFWTDEYWTYGHSSERWSMGSRYQWEPTDDYNDERYTRYTTVDGQLYGRLYTTNYIHKDIGWYQHYSSTTRAQLQTWMEPLFNLDFANPDAEHVVVLVSDGMPWWAGAGFPDTRSKDLCQYVADRMAERGVRIHTVTLDQSDESGDGGKGADAAFNASLVRNGGYAFFSYDAAKLTNLMIGVGQVEVGVAHLID